jgi:hypothetical protein
LLLALLVPVAFYGAGSLISRQDIATRIGLGIGVFLALCGVLDNPRSPTE